MKCPDNLIEELAYRRCVLFLGAGVSATSESLVSPGLHPLSWKNFIEKLRDNAAGLLPRDRRFVNGKIKQGDLLMALQVIYDHCDMGHYAKIINDSFANFGPSEIHKIILNLDSKIVITTNFDKIYDKLCTNDEYSIFDYSETRSIVAKLKAPTNVIIKAHGSIDDVNGMIFTAKQYAENMAKFDDFYALLSALFLTHTVIFIGYSLNDPDIKLVLHSLKGMNNVLSPHYLLTLTGQPEPIKKYWRDVYNISVIEYGKKYDELEGWLRGVLEQVIDLRRNRNIW